MGKWIKYSDGAIVLPLQPSCSSRHFSAALTAFVRPLPPSCGLRHLLAALTAFVRPLLLLFSQRSCRQEDGRLLADALIILVLSLILAGGTVAEQIDETDIQKILQIAWAESGSLIVPV
jgi:hypothetical protein